MASRFLRALWVARLVAWTAVALVCAIGGAIVLLHLPGWCARIGGILANAQEVSGDARDSLAQINRASAALPAAMESLKNAADTSNLASTQTLDLLGSTTKLVDHATAAADRLALVADAATGTLTQATAATKSLNDSIAEDGGKLGLALDAVPPVLAESAATLGAARRLLEDPALASAVRNADATSGHLARAANDLANKEHELFYPPPCTGKLCPLKKSWRLIRAVSGLAAPTYYGIGIARGGP